MIEDSDPHGAFVRAIVVVMSGTTSIRPNQSVPCGALKDEV